MKRQEPAPFHRMALCAWCKKKVKIITPSGVREIPVEQSGYTVKDFDTGGSHGICSECGEQLSKEAQELTGKQGNPKSWSLYKRIREGIFEPPVWAVDADKWKAAELDFYNTYYHRRNRKVKGSPYAVITGIYKRLGGRIKRKAKNNPTSQELNAILELFETFHGFTPDEVRVVKVKSDQIPGVLINIGELDELVYRSDKFDGRSRLYRHKFKKQKPTLAAGADGKLYIIAGDYTITERGIEG